MSDSVQHKYGAAGGVLVGRSHAKGGIRAVNKSTNEFLEMEGGEVVITKKAVSDRTKREFEGQMLTNREILSKINESGGGVSFAAGGEVPTDIYYSGKSYQYGGEVLMDHEIIHKISQCGCKHATKPKKPADDFTEASKIADKVLAKGGRTKPKMIELEISNDNPLSNQLIEITGDSFNLHDFEDIAGGDLSSGRPFRHKKSRKEFQVVTAVIYVEDDDFSNRVYQDAQGRKYVDPDGNGRLFTFTEEGEPLFQVATAKIVESFGNTMGVSTNSDDYKNPYEINRAVERLLDTKEDNQFTPEEKVFLSYYSGYGGLEKYGAEGKGILYEYYTPDAVVKKMWALAYKYGFGEQIHPHVFEPSVGTGNFLKYAPKDAKITANEINPYSARICKILYPAANVVIQSFEQNFISKNSTIRNNTNNLPKYDLVIGNPPYGKLLSKYIGMGEGDYTKAGNFTEYFITRGLDLLHPGGLLIFVVGAEQYNGGTLFLDGPISEVKKAIFEKAMLLDAYRLPTKIFERTGVASEIIVFKKY